MLLWTCVFEEGHTHKGGTRSRVVKWGKYCVQGPSSIKNMHAVCHICFTQDSSEELAEVIGSLFSEEHIYRIGERECGRPMLGNETQRYKPDEVGIT